MRRLACLLLLFLAPALASSQGGSPFTNPSSGGPAGDVTCTDCVALGTETTGNYAGSSSEGGAATTATALAANGANCAAASFPLGVDASGAVESCSTSISGNAATATALAANGANCAAGQFPLGVDTAGAAESCTAAATVAGADTQVIFNDGGSAFGGDAGLVYNKTTDTLTTAAGQWNIDNLRLDGDAISNQTLNNSIVLVPNGSGKFELRNGTTAQTAHFYRTFTDAINYERLAIQSGAGYFEVAVETAGTGTDNIDLRLTTAGTGQITTADGTRALPAIRVGSAGGASGLYQTNIGLNVSINGTNIFGLYVDEVRVKSNRSLGFSAGDPDTNSLDAALSRIAPGVVGVGTGPAGSTAGEIRASLYTATPQAATCADSGDANPGTLTLTPTSSRVHVTNSDADGCTLTMGETGMVSGLTVEVVVVSNAGGAVNFADTAGVTEIAGAFAAGLYDSLTLGYITDRWVQIARSDN